MHWLLLLVLPTTALACVPMKTPQPGIPVEMPGGTPGAALFQSPGRKCTDPPPRLAPKDYPTEWTNPLQLEIYSELPGPTVNADGETVSCQLQAFPGMCTNATRRCTPQVLSVKPRNLLWELVCLPKSNLLALREGTVEKDIPADAQFACFDTPCPPMHDLESRDTPMHPYSSGGKIKPELIGDTIWSSCPKGSAFYAMWTKTPENRHPPGIGPRCIISEGNWNGRAGYSCLKKACMPVTVAMDNAEYCPAAPKVCDFTQVDAKVDRVTCKDAQFTVKYTDPAVPGIQNSSTMLTCDTVTGKWKADDGFLIEMVQVNCGRNN